MIWRGKEYAARNSKKEFNNFLSIALGSASELETQLIISKNLNYLEKEIAESLIIELNSIQKMIHGLMKSLKSSDNWLLFTDHYLLLTNEWKYP